MGASYLRALFGTAYYNPSDENCDCGTIYELTPPANPGHSWAYTVPHAYTSGPPNTGEFPAAPLTVGPGGVLYGTTQLGGSSSGSVNCDTSDFSGCGTVFQLTPPSSPSAPPASSMGWRRKHEPEICRYS
jgi:hypothetical protein